ncbi:OsrF [Rhizobium leguminosarum bv. trifolii CB782]|nr:OsrF [Rhizobium leguminosarum bv. trifolii CB782]
MGRILVEKDVEAAVKGGSVYAAGGGGWADHGRMLGYAAVNVGKPELVSIDELQDEDWIATAAAIGAPASTTPWEMQGIDYVKAVQLLQEALGEKLSGLIIGQNGKSSTLNGWLPSAILGTKVVDAVGDIRAHPTGDMGSIGMAGSSEPMIQTAVGGNRAENRYIELVVKGATAKISPVLRAAADQSGGFIASCRNPLRASYVRSHAALGGISMALALGEAIIAAEKRGGSAVIDAICKTTGGHILAEGAITRKEVVYTKEAFDIGTIRVGAGEKSVTLHVMNEYMAVDDADGGRLATFPAVITTLSTEGEPLSVGQLREGMPVFILHVPMEIIPLSASVLDPSVYPVVEKAMGIEIARYALAARA